MNPPTNTPDDPPGTPDDPPGEAAVVPDDYAAFDAREALFTTALEQADRVANMAEAMRLQVMLAGFDAMVLEEQAQTGRELRSDDAAYRAFALHQATVLRTSRSAVERRIEDGRVAREKLPNTWTVFIEGRTSERAVAAAAAQTYGLPPEALVAFDLAAAELVETQKPTVVDRELGKLRDKLAPEAAIDRHEQAASRRYVAARLEGDGAAVLQIHTTAVDVAAMYDGIRQAAVAAHGREGECRTLGQLMADIATDLVVHGIAVPVPNMDLDNPSYPMERIGTLKAPHRKAIQATVLVVVPAETATGATKAPAEVAGMGSIDADVARRIVSHTRTWTRVAVDPIDDTVLGIDSHDRYVPTALKKLLHLRTPSCAGDDCGLPAHRGDIDHVTRVEHNGRTRHQNLQILCRKSHQMKDEGFFDVQPLPDGSIRWRDKWGGTRIVRPAVRIRTTAAKAS